MTDTQKTHRPSKGLFSWSPDYDHMRKKRIASRAKKFAKDQAALDEMWDYLLQHPLDLGRRVPHERMAKHLGTSVVYVSKLLQQCRITLIDMREAAVRAYAEAILEYGISVPEAWQMMGFGSRKKCRDYLREHKIPSGTPKRPKCRYPLSIRSQLNDAALRYVAEIEAMLPAGDTPWKEMQAGKDENLASKRKRYAELKLRDAKPEAPC